MLKIRSIILLILICAFYRIAAQEINILTYNIRYASVDSGSQNWNLRKEGVVSILKGHDFIGLQEVLPIQMEDFKNKLSEEYGFLFRTREANPSHGEGCPVLFNKYRWGVINSGFFWLSGTPLIPGSNTWGAACNRMVTFGLFRDLISGDSVLVINTHLDHISQTARENSVNLILEKFKKDIDEIPVVFMGDLNLTPDNPVYQKILSGTSLSDSYNYMHPEETSMGATFHAWTSEIPVQRIDYIFISPDLKVLSSQVLHNQFNGKYPSDHFPVNSILKKF
jgi:endonuclease/exonuclease/phosphatase family metal-dependent hydrolase